MKHRLALGGSALVVLLVVVAVVVALRDGDTPATSTGEAGWNAIAVLDRDAGEIVVIDAEGAELDRFDAGVGEPATFGGSRGSYVIVQELSGDAPEWAIVDTSNGDVVWNGAYQALSVAWLPGTTAPVAMSSDAAGSAEAFVIDATTGVEIDVADAAGFEEPWIGQGSGRASPDGRVVVVVDQASGGLATAVIDLDEQDALAVTGRFIGFAGVGDDVLGFIGATDAGDDRLVLIDRTGDELGSMAVPDAVGGAVLDQQTAAVSTTNGELLHVDISADEPGVLDDVGADGPVTVQSIPDAERLVATLSTGLRLLTTDGDELAAVDGTRMFTSINERTACLHVVDGDDVAHLIDVETGEDLATTEHPDTPDVLSSDDGCTVTYRTADGVVTLGRSGDMVPEGVDAVADVAPDNSALLVHGDGGSVSLIDLDDPVAEAVDTDHERTSAVFVNR